MSGYDEKKPPNRAWLWIERYKLDYALAIIGTLVLVALSLPTLTRLFG